MYNSTRIRWARHIACMGEPRHEYKETTRRPMRRGEENTEIDGRLWTRFIWLRIGTVVNTVMDLRIP
jgi:hypothetical protein